GHHATVPALFYLSVGWRTFHAMPSSLSQKLPNFGEELLQPIMMTPMTVVLENGDAGIPEMHDPAILHGVGGPAFTPVHQQRRTADPRPQMMKLVACQVDR